MAKYQMEKNTENIWRLEMCSLYRDTTPNNFKIKRKVENEMTIRAL